MTDNQSSSPWPAVLIGLRALLMLLGGLFALLFPADALALLVLLAGALFLVDGVLGLWAITFGRAKTGNFWFDVVRNVLSILAGVLILISPLIATLITATVLIYIIAIQAIIVGAMEIYLVIKERDHYAKIWPVLLSGILYVLFGLMLIVAPLLSAVVLVMIGGAMMVVFSVSLFVLAWRIHKSRA